FQMNGGHLDAAQYNVFLNPVTGGDYENWQFTGVWFAATKSNIDLNVDNGGTITNFLVVGGYMSNATVGAVAVTRGITGFQLDGVTIVADQTTDASYAAVEFYTAGGASPSKVRVVGCDITAGSTAAACVRISSGTTRFVLAFNILTGSTDADGLVINGALSSKRVVGDHVLPG
ncbi:MAG: hypothetical protein IT196_13315, partial [Acidimicrobiales bacterium]|nr:hypothetical protein [Acidimicrobiales bacterium]